MKLRKNAKSERKEGEKKKDKHEEEKQKDEDEERERERNGGIKDMKKGEEEFGKEVGKKQEERMVYKKKKDLIRRIICSFHEPTTL